MSKSQQGNAAEQLRFTDEQFIWKFSPNQTDPELLEAIFVGREALLQNVLEKIADSASSDSTHHVLLYGPRGIGKSHFTALLHHRIRRDRKLNDAVHIAWLNEDETTTSTVQLLVRIYRALCKGYPDEYSAQWLNDLLDQTPREIAEVLTRRLVARFDNRRLVIMVENLNLLFESLGKSGQHDLRALLQEEPFACLVATSQQLFKAVADRSEPFFGFFQQIALKPLTLEDARTLLANIARAKGQDDLAAFIRTPDGRGRVRAVHDLAGGNHRVYIVLSGFVTKESLDSLVVPFQKMADDLTPYYQERLRWISPLQRQIVELLCRVHGTINPKEISRRLLVEQGSIGKQVRELEKIGYLNSTKRGRETFYELSEPLMRLAYEVKEQSLLEMLVEFLRVWYRPDQLMELRSSGLSPCSQEYADAAWERSQSQPDPRLKLLQEEIAKAKSEGRVHDLAMLWEEKAAASNSADDWYQAGYWYRKINKDFDASINCFEEVIEIAPEHIAAWNNKGASLYDVKRPEEAIACYENLIEIDPEYAAAWNNKGVSLDNAGRFEEAISCYEKAIEIDGQDACAWNNKGVTLNNLGQQEEAIACYEKSIEVDPKYTFPRFNLSEAYFALQRWRDGFKAIHDAFAHLDFHSAYFGDAAAMLGLIFRLSEDHTQRKLRISKIVDLYQQVARDRGFQDQVAQPPAAMLSVSPLSHLADGLVKSLGEIDAECVTLEELKSYLTAVERRVADLPEFEIALRLFRYGIRYLISGKESEFVELIRPERRILRQALGLLEEPEK